MASEEFVAQIAEILASKKCSDIVAIDVTKKTDIANAFVICTAKNANMGRSAYEELCEKLEAQGIRANRVDGERDGRWIVVDYSDVIVHIFHTDMRDFYKFEKLWAEEDGSNVKHFDE